MALGTGTQLPGWKVLEKVNPAGAVVAHRTPKLTYVIMSKHAASFDWRGLRQVLGLTQADMAVLLCVHHTEVARFENGRRNPHKAALVLLRAWLLHPIFMERLKKGRYSHPFPEDVNQWH